MNTDAFILVHKVCPKRTGFNMYAEYTGPQLTFLALEPWAQHSLSEWFPILIFNLFKKFNL